MSEVFNIDQGIIQIDNDKDIEFFSKNFIDVFLKASWSIREAKKHDLVLKIAITSFESHFLFIVFSDLYLIINTYQI